MLTQNVFYLHAHAYWSHTILPFVILWVDGAGKISESVNLLNKKIRIMIYIFILCKVIELNYSKNNFKYIFLKLSWLIVFLFTLKSLCMVQEKPNWLRVQLRLVSYLSTLVVRYRDLPFLQRVGQPWRDPRVTDFTLSE